MKKEKNKTKQTASSLDIKSEIKRFIRLNRLNLCLECGKCSAVCPMMDFYGEYVYQRSPRGVVEQLLFDLESIQDEETLWYCLTCRECTFFCATDVNFQGFMLEVRELLLKHGHNKFATFCSSCGCYLMPRKEVEYLQKDVDNRKLGELLSVCAQCKTNSHAEMFHRVAPVYKNQQSV